MVRVNDNARLCSITEFMQGLMTAFRAAGVEIAEDVAASVLVQAVDYKVRDSRYTKLTREALAQFYPLLDRHDVAAVLFFWKSYEPAHLVELIVEEAGDPCRDPANRSYVERFCMTLVTCLVRERERFAVA